MPTLVDTHLNGGHNLVGIGITDLPKRCGDVSQASLYVATALVYCNYVLVFPKKSHRPHLFQPPHFLIQELLHPLHVYSSLLGY
jgi:hypothetical protein